MKVDVLGATNTIQAEAVERALLDAFAKAGVDARRPSFADDEASKAIDPVSAGLIVSILNTKSAVLAVQALLGAIPIVYNDLKNRDVHFNFHGYSFNHDDFLAGKLSALKSYVSAAGGQRKQKRYALLICVSDSTADKKIPKLDYASKDLERVRDVLSTNDPDCLFEVSTLINPNAADMRDKIHATLVDRFPGEEVLIFYSGHGIRTNQGTFLCANNTELARLEINGTRLDDIGRFASNSRASQTLIVLDCCYSGGASDSIFSELLTRVSNDRSIHLLTSTSANRVSKESKKLQSSIFTYYFVEGIVNGMAATDDGAITASSIHSYVQKRVKEEGIEPPKYNVKNRNDEFVIKSKVTTIDQTFREVKSTLLSMNDQKLISLDDVTKVLNNCFGSADTPRKLDQDCIKNFYDYHRKRIDFDEFARGQKLKGPKAWVGWILIAATLLFFIMYLWANSA